MRNHGQGAQPNAGGIKDRVTDCRGETNDRGLPCTGRREVLAVEDHDFDFRYIFEPRNAILAEVGVRDSSVLKTDSFEERSANSLHDSALNLVAQSFGVYDRAAFKCLDDSADVDGA